MISQYQKNITNVELLYILYLKMEQKINELIILLKKNKNIENSKKINDIKNILFEVFDILINNTNNKELKNIYIYLMNKISSNNIDNIKIVLNFCKNSKK